MSTVADNGSGDRLAFTVSELTTYVKALLDRDEVLSQASVRGEISNFAAPGSGHLYFSLKDEHSQLRCVCFRGDACRLGFEPEDGQRVLAHGNVTVYEPRGEYQLIVRAMRPDGAGELAEAIKRLRAKLEAEGLFEPSRKRPLPRFPRRIALVTSPTGAAVRDLITVISRRFPPAELTVVPTVVQGEAAPESIVGALSRATKLLDPELVIVGRGGGSLEDLWAFYDERVVRAVFACPVPIISAVGHETDLSLCDEVADARAPTPSAAGELAVPDASELRATVERLGERAEVALARRLEASASRLSGLCERPVIRRPRTMVETRYQRLDEAALRLVRGADVAVERVAGRLAAMTATLRTLDPRVRRRLTALDRQHARIEGAGPRALTAVQRRMERLDSRLQAASARLAARPPAIDAHGERVETLRRRARTAVARSVERVGARLQSADSSLRALSPRRVIERGYALVWRDADQHPVHRVGQVTRGDGIHVSVTDGEIAARVTGTGTESADDG